MTYKKGQIVLVLRGDCEGKIGVICKFMKRSRFLKVKVKDKYIYVKSSDVSTLREPTLTWAEFYKLTGFIPDGVNLAR